MLARRFAWGLLLLTVSAAPALRAEDGAAAADPFPDLEALRPNVDFWTRVFGEWGQGQVVIHDLEHPAIVYEVVELPGEIGESYTEAQKDWIETTREDWEIYLERLAWEVEVGHELDEVDKQWVLHFATLVGADKLAGAHARVRSQRGLRERFREGLARSHRLDGVIRGILREEGLPEDLVYLPHVESSFQYHARSTAGATGLWQFTRGTGRQYLTINPAVDERLDPVAATRGAARYLADAYEKLGAWPLALTSYNHGVHGMLRAKKRFGPDFERIVREYDGRSFGFASKNFYAEFLAARRIARQPELWFPEGYSPEPEWDLESVVLDHRVTPDWLASRYGVPLETLAELNPAWSRRAVNGGLRLPVGTEIWLPPGTLAASGGSRRPPSTAGAGGGGSYVVRRGDTLSDIAADLGMSLSRLRELNGLPRDSSLIHVGQRLVVDAASPAAEHVVRSGETLGHIAERYRVRLADLLAANMLTMRSVIRPGQVLRIPR
jgi:membrane-bound lytic murein transglycosylase D